MHKPPVFLIHGTWGCGENWKDFAGFLREEGYKVYTPTLRHHGIFKTKAEWRDNAEKVSQLGLLDYIADLQSEILKIEAAPIIVGHSFGGLLAQLLAMRVKHKGLVLIGTAPAAGIFGFYPKQVKLWGPYAWRILRQKPLLPISFHHWKNFICNRQSKETQTETYQMLCAESGKAYFEMCLWFIDKKQAAKVAFDKIKSPVLVIAAGEDKCTGKAISRATARKYKERAEFVEIKGSDHMMNIGPYMKETLRIFNLWVEKNFMSKMQGM